nr:MAG TPA: hypothetical protein [Caudoviricetes sp.]
MDKEKKAIERIKMASDRKEPASGRGKGIPGF